MARWRGKCYVSRRQPNTCVGRTGEPNLFTTALPGMAAGVGFNHHYLLGQRLPGKASASLGRLHSGLHGKLTSATKLISDIFWYLPLQIMSFFTLIIVLLVLSPKNTGHEVFQTFGVDVTSTVALEIVASQAFIFYSLLGSDSTAHMAEETQHVSSSNECAQPGQKRTSLVDDAIITPLSCCIC